MDDIQNFVSDRIQRLREEKGISSRELSLLLGQSHSYINQIENRKLLPSLYSLSYICTFFEITLSDFFDENKKHPKQLAHLLEITSGMDIMILNDLINLASKIRALEKKRK